MDLFTVGEIFPLTNQNICSILILVTKTKKSSALMKIVGAIFALDFSQTHKHKIQMPEG